MGDTSRFTKNFIDSEVSRIFWDLDNGDLPTELSPAYTRPAYAYTKAAVGGVNELLNV